MPIPNYQSIMLPLLSLLSDGKECSMQELIAPLAKTFNLSEDEKKELLPSGKTAKFYNRVHWAKFYLKEARLLEVPKKRLTKITNRGLDILKQNPTEINVAFLMQFPEFRDFRNRRKPDSESMDSPDATADVDDVHKTPEEELGEAYHQIRHELSDEILTRIKGCSPVFFERLVVDLLVQMGYGGSIEDAGKVIGKSGDGGIDGVIKEDRLGLDVIYIQAKRWDNVVGRPEIQKFAGALQGQRAKKGVFITTSSFTNDALEYVSTIDSRIVLIDGEQLAQLMIDYDLGVSKVISYDIKRLDSDYFSDE